MHDWYYADTPKTRQGPVSTATVLQLRQAGSIDDDTLLWRDGLTGWLPLRELSRELGTAVTPAASPADALPASPATVAGEASWTLAPVETSVDTPAPGESVGSAWRPVSESANTAATASPYAPPVAPVAMRDRVVQGGEVVMAGFLKRAAASVIDSLIVGIGSMIVGGVIGGVIGGLMGVSGLWGSTGMLLIQALSNLIGLAIGVTYYAWFHASESMATPGKMAVGIKVVRLNGERISIARGIGRYFATILSAIPLFIGFFMAGFTARKQALHDMVCDTLVVDRWAFTPHPGQQRHELGTVTVAVLAVTGVLLGLLVLALAGVLGLAAFA